MSYNSTSQNNSQDKQSVNTRSYQFMNKDGFDPSTMSFGYWDDMVSLRFNPALEASKRTDKSVFDYNKAVSTALTLDKVMLLMYKINKEIIPAIENSEEKVIGIQIGGNASPVSVLVVGTGVARFGKVTPYIGLHKALNSSTRVPEMSIFYQFKNGECIDNYNESDGTCDYSNDIPVEFYLFTELLKTAIIGLSHSVTHSGRHVNKYKNDRLENAVFNIAEKNGIAVSRKSSFGGSQINWGGNSNTTSSDSTDNLEAGNLDDLDSLLG